MRDTRDDSLAADATRSSALWKPRGALPVLLGALAGLALCAVVILALTLAAAPPPDPAPTARMICADLTSQRYDSLYTLLAPSLQSQGTQAQFVASQRQLDVLLGPVQSCQTSIDATSGGVARVALTLQRGQAAAAQARLALTQAPGGWRISSYDQRV